MVIALGSDHGGFCLKETIKQFLTDRKITFQDFGTFSTAAVDYPDIAKKVAQAVMAGQCNQGILVCGTGVGISIAANKIKGIRAALCHDPFSAQMARQHNDANILAMGERVIGTGLALAIVEKWLESKFEGGRHQGRVGKITEMEG
jgi:ribose 5-phosphate isomerase B